MIQRFVESLVTGTKVSGTAMKQLLNPINVMNGWNKAYDVSLPRLGEIVTDTGAQKYPFTEPLTPNDRVYEALGSYAYRAGLSFLPKDFNIAKFHILKGNSLGGPLTKFETLFESVYKDGSVKVADELATKMQMVSATLPTVLLFNTSMTVVPGRKKMFADPETRLSVFSIT